MLKVRFEINFLLGDRFMDTKQYMNLKQYLFYFNLSLTEFASLCSLSATYLGEIMRGKLKPSGKALKLIEMASEGWVSPEYAFKPTIIPKFFKKYQDAA